MSIRSIAKVAALVFAATVLASLVYAAQLAANPEEVVTEDVPEVLPAAVLSEQPPPEPRLLPSTKAALLDSQDLLPSTKADAGLGARVKREQDANLLPSTKASEIDSRRLLPSTKAAPPRLEQLQPQAQTQTPNQEAP